MGHSLSLNLRRSRVWCNLVSMKVTGNEELSREYLGSVGGGGDGDKRGFLSCLDLEAGDSGTGNSWEYSGTGLRGGSTGLGSGCKAEACEPAQKRHFSFFLHCTGR